MVHINNNTKEMIYSMFIWSRYKKNHFGNEEGTSVSKYTKALVRLYSNMQIQSKHIIFFQIHSGGTTFSLEEIKNKDK